MAEQCFIDLEQYSLRMFLPKYIIVFSTNKICMSLHFDDIDAKRAEEIARNFLQQHHSVFIIKSIFENGIWVVEAKTSAFSESVKKLRIDAKTGKIIAIE